MSDVTMNDHSGFIRQSMNEKIEAALEAVGIHLEGEAKEELENDPMRMDTGLLRNSITHAVSGKKAAISVYHADRGSNRDSSGKRISANSENAGSVKIGYYRGTAPSAPPDRQCVYIGTNVEYAA